MARGNASAGGAGDAEYILTMTISQEYSIQFWEQIAKEEQARLARYKQAWQYYHGQHEPSLAVKVNQANDNLVVNLYKYIIDKGVSFLFGKEIEFQLEEGADTDSEKYLADVWESNDKMAFLHDVALNGANCGHCFIEISPRDGDLPELINHDPALWRPQWDPNNIKRVLWYKNEWTAIGADGKVTNYKRMIERNDPAPNWIISRYIRREGQVNYMLDGEPVIWDYDFPPVIDWKNLPAPNEYFGAPDVENLAMQNSINFGFSNTQRILRYHGHPKTIGAGFVPSQLVDSGPSDMVVLPDPNGKVWNLEMASDLSSAKAFLDTLVDLFLRVNHVPNMDPAKVSLGALSGFAIRLLHSDLLDQNETKRRLYGGALKETNRRLLILAGRAETRTTRVVWPNPLPENKTELIQQLTQELDAQLVSRETAQQELGRDPKVEAERLQAEQLQGNSIGAELLRAFNRGTGQ